MEHGWKQHKIRKAHMKISSRNVAKFEEENNEKNH